MTIEQVVEIPADYRLLLELPRSIPTGVKARVEISIPEVSAKGKNHSAFSQSAEIEDVRLLLQKEMAEKGTSALIVETGDGWEAHIREHYAES